MCSVQCVQYTVCSVKVCTMLYNEGSQYVQFQFRWCQVDRLPVETVCPKVDMRGRGINCYISMDQGVGPVSGQLM